MNTVLLCFACHAKALFHLRGCLSSLEEPWQVAEEFVPLHHFFNRRQAFFSTELLVLGWEVGISGSGAQHAFLHELLGFWVQDNPDELR